MASDTVLACDSSSSTHSRPVTQVQVPVGVAGPRTHVWNGRGPFSISGPDPSPAARRVLRLDGRRPASGPVTVDTQAPEDFNESSIPQVYEPIYILYQYVSVCIASDGYRGFFLSTKMYVLAGIRTYLVIYARICLASFGLPDSGAVLPTALRAYRNLN